MGAGRLFGGRAVPLRAPRGPLPERPEPRRRNEKTYTHEGTTFRTRNVVPDPVATAAVRRLTPTECERLQGFPDGWTAITWKGKPAADGPRYKALGNSMAVPVMAHIGKRIAEVAAKAGEK